MIDWHSNQLAALQVISIKQNLCWWKARRDGGHISVNVITGFYFVQQIVLYKFSDVHLIDRCHNIRDDVIRVHLVQDTDHKWLLLRR